MAMQPSARNESIAAGPAAGVAATRDAVRALTATLKPEATPGAPGPAGDAAPRAEAPAGAASRDTVGEKADPAAKGRSTQERGQRLPHGHTSAREELEQLQRVGDLPITKLAPSWLISALVHMVGLLLLGLVAMPEETRLASHNLVAGPVDDRTKELEEIDVQEVTLENQADIDAQVSDVVSTAEPLTVAEEVGMSALDELPAPQASLALDQVGLLAAPDESLLSEIGSVAMHGLAGRGEAARKLLVLQRGGTHGSEAAVELALRWFAQHQNANGSWSFDHRGGRCQGRCADPGSLAGARLAATGMALLPFLGAGQTHKEGKYKDTVKKGLYFLINNMKVSSAGGDMTVDGGMMYGHGICSIALCEAYAMTHDRALAAPAQAALNFIMYAQDPRGGGWRYKPGQSGDTSVVGWQIMALKSGHLAYLQVHPQVIRGAVQFLNSVEVDEGAAYGYDHPGNGPATSAVGLLCRMHLGWKREEPALARGVQALADMGPSPSNMYFNYYATQVLHHYEGELWGAWNEKMRDQLVASQSKEGHQAGSWYIPGDHGSEPGGRVYSTSMAAMILEVYYRHMPLYETKSTQEEFD